MEFIWSDTALISIVVFGAALLLVVWFGIVLPAIRDYTYYTRRRNYRRKVAIRRAWWTAGNRVLGWAITWLVVGAILNGITWAASRSATKEMPTYTMGASTFGLESGTEYPLVLGIRTGGSQIDATLRSGLFTASATVSSTPASSFPVSFEHEGKTYMLELPASQVVFDTTAATSADAAVTVYLVNKAARLGEYSYESCRFTITNLVAWCMPNGEAIFTPSDDTLRRGLAPIVQASLDSATVKLTPEMYNQLLGRISDTTE